jgi:glycosyltransferase involved in cell wall biosynthesis
MHAQARDVCGKRAEGGLRLQRDLKRSKANEKGQARDESSDFSKNPILSIITVVYNGERFLEETILSVITQQYDNIEYIVIDGGSVDRSLEIIRKYQHAIDYWVSESDHGLYHAMNKGIDLATGEWISFINAGDRLLYIDEDSLRKRKETCTSYYVNQESGSLCRDPFTRMYLTRNTPCHQSIFYRKEQIVHFDTSYPLVADFHQMTRIVTRSFFPAYCSHIVLFACPGISKNYVRDKSWPAMHERVKIILQSLGYLWGFLSVLHVLRIKVRFMVINIFERKQAGSKIKVK